MASRRFINIKFNVWHDIVLIQLNDRSLLCQLAALYDIPLEWNWSLTWVGVQSHKGESAVSLGWNTICFHAKMRLLKYSYKESTGSVA